jgi:hypothetical protein
MKPAARVIIVSVAFLLLTWSTRVIAHYDGPDQPDSVVKRSDVYCTGYIAEVAPRAELQVIGGEKENERNSFAQGDVVYVSKGREGGIRAGAVYYILRPVGEVKHPFTRRRVGHLVRELGMLRVIEVQPQTSTAEVLVSCDQIEMGDLLMPYEAKSAPGPRDARPLPRYSEGSGGTTGQIILSPQGREYFAANNVVYIDLGRRQGVQAGDYFTIYRTIDKTEGVTHMPDDHIVNGKSYGYGSLRYKGTEHSMSSPRVKREEVLRNRPTLPRKVLGEMVVIRVENNSAVALITRTVSEVNIGDHIERAN